MPLLGRTFSLRTQAAKHGPFLGRWARLLGRYFSGGEHWACPTRPRRDPCPSIPAVVPPSGSKSQHSERFSRPHAISWPLVAGCGTKRQSGGLRGPRSATIWPLLPWRGTNRGRGSPSAIAATPGGRGSAVQSAAAAAPCRLRHRPPAARLRAPWRRPAATLARRSSTSSAHPNRTPVPVQVMGRKRAGGR
jgi:hypothetical protein